MTYETVPLSRLAANLRATLEDCVATGKTIVVELPGKRRVVVQPVPDALDAEEEDADDLIDRLIESNAAFRDLLRASDASGRKPMNLELEPE